MHPPRSPDWTLDLAHATATHVSGVTVVALPDRRGYRVVPLPGTLPAPGPGLSDDDRSFLDRVLGDRVREGGRLLRERLRRRATLH